MNVLMNYGATKQPSQERGVKKQIIIIKSQREKKIDNLTFLKDKFFLYNQLFYLISKAEFPKHFLRS